MQEVATDSLSESGEATRPLISVIIPVYNSAPMLRRSLAALRSSRCRDYELIVVDDGSTDESPAVAQEAGARLFTLPDGPYGPAHARNHGAEQARGSLLFFVDADVLVRDETLDLVAAGLADAEVSALFGSYDERPDIPDFTSQYKNLFHSFVHQNARREAGTFWSGCGAIRREVFLAAGGFDAERYRRPSIEDIELGYQLVAAGHRIVLDKAIQVTHLKRWTLPGLLRTDFFERGIPWTRLSLRTGHLPDDLNLRLSQRVSAALLGLLLLLLVLTAPLAPAGLLLLVLVTLYLIVIGYWPASVTAPVADAGRALLLTGALVTLLVTGVWWGGWLVALLPLLPAALVVGPGRGWVAASAGRRQLAFALLVGGTVASGLLLLAAMPSWLAGAIALLVGAIALLNRDFYRFFARKRGPLFAVAVLPFHLLYYLYSTLAFVIGTLAHLWTTRTQNGSLPL